MPSRLALLGHPAEQVVLRLLGHEADESAVPGLHLTLGQAPAGEVAGPGVEHVAVAHHPLEGAPQLLGGDLLIDVMDLVKVDPIGLQPA